MYRVYYEDVLKTDADLKKEYIDGKKEKALSAEEMIKRCDAKIEKTKEESIAAIKKGYACHSKLRKVALRPMGTSMYEYIEQIMEMETKTHQKGAEERVKQLRELKENYDIVAMIEKGDESAEESLWKEASDKMQKERGENNPTGFSNIFSKNDLFEWLSTDTTNQ